MRYDTEEAALRRVAELADQGYEYIPYDEPMIAMRGMVCWKKMEDGQEDVEDMISWPMFGEEYETDKQRVSPVELIEFAESFEVERCDEPKQLRMGFVNYDHDNKKAVVRTIKVLDLRKVSNETKQRFLDKRDEIEASDKAEFNSKKLREIALKIGGYRSKND
jgi:hypothetical protein